MFAGVWLLDNWVGNVDVQVTMGSGGWCLQLQGGTEQCWCWLECGCWTSGVQGKSASEWKGDEECAWRVVACPDITSVISDHTVNIVPASGLAGGDDIRAGDVGRDVRL